MWGGAWKTCSDYENGVVIRERDAAMLAALDVPVPKVQLEQVC